ISCKNEGNDLIPLTNHEIALKLAQNANFTSYTSKVTNLQYYDVLPNYAARLEPVVDISTEEEAIGYLSNIFSDGREIYEEFNTMRALLMDLQQAVPELQNLDKRDFEETLNLAFQYSYETSQIGRVEGCDKGCALGAAIGLAFCLPSLGAAGFGYFICAAGVATSTITCCYVE
ncbi:MAG: hypothetical protein AAF789_10415, partial [Bacteroidota bacterium]